MGDFLQIFRHHGGLREAKETDLDLEATPRTRLLWDPLGRTDLSVGSTTLHYNPETPDRPMFMQDISSQWTSRKPRSQYLRQYAGQIIKF